MSVSQVLVLLAVILFVFATFHFNPFGLELVPLGLAFWAASAAWPVVRAP
jgi:hypothetical protein